MMSSGLPQGWEEKELSELVLIKGGKRLPKGSSLQANINSHPYLRVRDMSNRIIKLDDLEYVSDETFEKIKRYIVNTNDLILSIVGTVGLVCIIDEKLDNASLTENCVKLNGLNKSDSLFIYYYLTSYLGQNEIKKGTVGAVQPKLPIYNIEKIKILLPKEDERKRIADILSAFDDKIELNNQMNKTLEDMATALFKEWFENFNFPNDEGKAYKDNGGEFKASELGEIPVYWEVKCLKDISKIVMGQSPKGKSYNTENIGFPLINGASDFEGTLPKPKKHTTEPTKISEDNDIVFGIRATIGNVVFIKKGYCLGRGVSAVRVNEDLLEFTFLLLQKEIINLAQLATGSVFANLTKNDLEKLKIVFPSNDILVRFSKQIKPLLEQIKLNNQENKILKVQRDTLLPKLMSGKKRV